VKRIWTPSWTLFSGGVCFFYLAAFSWVIEIKKQRGLAFPLVVIGMNSLAAYLIAHLCEEFVESSIRINLGAAFLNMLGSALVPIVLGTLTLGIYWLMLFWMYRKKLFIRI
jgi:predicted acyltransferase